ncbi:MAG TPA: GNAT family N-acetyltransferase [Methanocorpusculum sp.]|nr:GNAT family N-acetyltransferase [Methanocorpusculum sp.]
MAEILTAEDMDLAVHILTESFMKYPVPGGMIKDEERRRKILKLIWEHELARVLPISYSFFDDEKIAFGVLCPLGKFIGLPVNISPEFVQKAREIPVHQDEARHLMGVDAEGGKIRRSFNLPPDTIYLYSVGVLPGHQGKGTGTAIIKRMLAKVDELKKDAYLETHTEQNARYYARFGFETIKQTVNEELGITEWYMIRKPGGGKA